jgi:hypothetical protein
MTTEGKPLSGETAGLCAQCLHRKRLRNDRGSVFLFCRKSETDPAYPKYPRLPVLRCAGFVPSAP